jgi:hypothetical protein
MGHPGGVKFHLDGVRFQPERWLDGLGTHEKPQLRGVRLGRRVAEEVGLGGFDDFAGLDAAGADADALAVAAAFDLGLHRAQVDVPTAAGGVIGVGDVVAELRAFAAEIAFGCHVELQF